MGAWKKEEVLEALRGQLEVWIERRNRDYVDRVRLTYLYNDGLVDGIERAIALIEKMGAGND